MDRATMMIMLVLFCAIAFYGYRLARGDNRSDGNEFDAGSAILDFARAFPGEAIRSLHLTADNEAVFVRLHDNRSGFMRNMGNHFACLLLDAKTLHVTPLYSGDGLLVMFDEWPKFNGEYRFKTHEEAADVALWLLASLTEHEALADVNAASDSQTDDDLDQHEPDAAQNIFEDPLDAMEADIHEPIEDRAKLGVDPLTDQASGSTVKRG